MSLTATIGNNNINLFEGTWKMSDKIDQQGQCNFTIIDTTGLASFSKYQPVVVTDSITGVIFDGIVDKAKATKLYPNAHRMWSITCTDETYLLSKRTSRKQYKAQFAGTIVADQIQRYGASEGVTGAFALDWDEQFVDWQAGILSGTTATTNASNNNPGDGDLELSPAGTDTNYSEGATGGFSGNALKLTASAQAGYASAVVYRKVWSGSQTIVSGDFLSYDVWVPSTNPGIYASVDMAFSDGTFLSANAQGGNDNQGLSSLPSNDLSGLANDQWYSRNHAPFGSVIGKTITGMYVTLYGTTEGSYEAYFRRILWKNGGTTKISVFVDNTTAPAVNVQGQNTGFLNVNLGVVQAAEKTGSATTTINLSSVAIVKKSSVAWETEAIGLTTISNPSAILLESSIDGGLSWMTCASGSPIPQLIAGMVTSSLTLKIRKTITQTTNPDASLLISGVKVIVESSYASSKTDVSKTYAAADFPGGTNSNTVTNGANLTMAGKLVPFSSIGDYNGVTTQFGIASGIFLYKKTLAFNNSLTGASQLRLDNVGNTWKDFTVEIDIYISPNAADENGLTFRTTNYGSGAASFSYFAGFTQTSVVLKKGTNTTGGTTITTIQTATIALNAQSTHRLKVVANGTTLQVYCDDVLMINTTDSSFNIAGYFGLRLNNTTGTSTQVYYSNFGVSSALSGIWTAPTQISIAGAGTYGNSIVFWDDNQTPDTTSIAVNASYDNGFSWNPCTNGAELPGFTPGQSLTGKNVLMQVVLTSNNASTFPSMAGLSFIVMGQFSASGTRVSPALSLSTVLPRAGTALVNWNANQPTNTSVAIATSIDGKATWQGVAAPGNGITGINVQPTAYYDSFDSIGTTYVPRIFGGTIILPVTTVSNYTQTFLSGSGTVANWLWDTPNSRLIGTQSSGFRGALQYTGLSFADGFVDGIFDKSDTGGLITRMTGSNNAYYLVIRDASANSGTQNTATLNKIIAGTITQIAQVAISFPRGTYHKFLLDAQGSALTVLMDGQTIISATDTSLTAAGNAGVLCATAAGGVVELYSLRIQPYGDDVHSKTVYTRITLTSTDPTVTPQMLDMQCFVSSPAIGPGTLIPAANYDLTFLDANLNDLTTQSNYWNNIKNKAISFQARNALPAPWPLASVNQSVNVGGQNIGDVLNDSLSLEPNGDLYRNRMTIKGAIDTAIFTEIKTGDGTTRSWNMTNPLVSAPIILLNGQAQSVGVQGIDSGKAFYWQPNSTAINQDVGGTVLQPLIDQLSITGTCSFEVDVTIDNTGVNNPSALPTVALAGTFNQGQMAALLPGTSGIVESVYDATGQGMTKAAATTYATQLLQRYGLKDGRTLTFKTLRSGLAAGMQLTAFVPEQNCMDVTFLVVQVDATITTLANGVQQYFYTIIAMEGANLGSWVRIFSSLLSR